MYLHKQWFDREVEIVQPRSIIAIGRKAFDLIQFGAARQATEINWVYHYAFARRGDAAENSFEWRFREIIQKYRES